MPPQTRSHRWKTFGSAMLYKRTHPGLPPLYEAVAVQYLQVLRDVGLAGARLGDEVSHRSFTPPEHIQNPEAHRFGERLEALRDHFGGFIGQAHGARWLG